MAATVVVADDHEEMRHLVVELLEAEGYEVRQATDTQGVLDEVARAKPDLLILDVHMPGAGGVEALKTIRRDPDLNGMRVLLLSGSVDLATDWPSQIGADAHLPKPFPIDDLNSTVRSLLDSV
jgi:two-component system, OmpR family, alkaline phosphatase synthesis response regulator PhoP